MRCYLCGRGLTQRTRAHLRPESRLILAIFNIATPCNRVACLRRTARTLRQRTRRA